VNSGVPCVEGHRPTIRKPAVAICLSKTASPSITRPEGGGVPRVSPGQSLELRRRSVGPVHPWSCVAARGCGTSARFSTRRKQGGPRRATEGNGVECRLRFARSALNPYSVVVLPSSPASVDNPMDHHARQDDPGHDPIRRTIIWSSNMVRLKEIRAAVELDRLTGHVFVADHHQHRLRYLLGGAHPAERYA
jgi:hypothetical protein